MDEASKLVLELQKKLSELDHKVWQYRRDMASEFTKYTESVLRDVPEHVSETVSKAIAESVKACKSLNPAGLSSIESPCATGNDSLANRVENGVPPYFTISTPAMPHQRTSQEVDIPRSPHEREKEFQGVFTPSYLPLLDSTTRNERRSSSDPQISPPLDTEGKENEMAPSHADASTDTRSLAPSLEFRRPDTPKRKNTDEWSGASDVSDGPVRRSALRRSSSTSKGTSPRRVRFDVAGEEVLPTSSPLPAPSILAEDVSNTLDTSSDEEAGSEQVEDIDDVPPKRISSSQALRALSRGPLEDDGTQWTTVSAPPDGSASVPAVSSFSQGNSEEDLSINMTKSGVRFAATEPFAITESTAADIKPVISHKSGDNANNSEAQSDDEMLDMAPLKSMRGQKSVATKHPTIAPLNTNKSPPPTAAPSPPNKPSLAMDDFISKQAEMGEDFQLIEEQEMFDFDENIQINDQRSPPEADHVDTDSDSPVSPAAGKPPMSLSEYSRSPARGIPKPAAPKQSPAPSKGVVGSYKGRPFNMPIVSDEIHAQAASLGAVSSFVGSVNGRSGLDESDVQSYRASGGGMYTTASMSERMAMDDLRDASDGRQYDVNDL